MRSLIIQYKAAPSSEPVEMVLGNDSTALKGAAEQVFAAVTPA
jgi:hypothetical protein